MRLRRVYIFAAVVGFVVAVTTPAAAHHLVVDPPGGGHGTQHWVGGGPLPAQAQGTELHAGFTETGQPAMFPAAHSAGPNDDKGLVQSCLSTRDNPVVAFIPRPPFLPDTDCMHGEPRP
jgi:hypothetical protein